MEKEVGGAILVIHNSLRLRFVVRERRVNAFLFFRGCRTQDNGSTGRHCTLEGVTNTHLKRFYDSLSAFGPLVTFR